MNKTMLRFEIAGDVARSRFLKRLTRSRRTPKIMVPDLQAALSLHRSELRSEHLALGFLRGHPYSAMEKPLRPAAMGHISTKNQTRTFPDFDRIEDLIVDYGISYKSKSELLQSFAEWRDAAIGVS